MVSLVDTANMIWTAAVFDAKFDREPFGFEHNLHTLDLFRFDRLVALAHKYADFDQDYFVAGSASTPGAEFYSVPTLKQKPHEALERLDTDRCRVLVKRPEKFDTGFADLLRDLFGQVRAASPALRTQEIVRLESAVFISSAAATTPFHFDPEINFFSQIEGEKIYRVYPPAAVAEAELERHYKRGIINIGQLDLAQREAALEHVFALKPGLGLHQPQDAPHWVETTGARSISYSFVFETAEGRAKGRTRSCNHYLRKLGLDPTPPGQHPGRDAFKSRTMELLIPARKRVARSMRSMLGR